MGTQSTWEHIYRNSSSRQTQLLSDEIEDEMDAMDPLLQNVNDDDDGLLSDDGNKKDDLNGFFGTDSTERSVSSEVESDLDSTQSQSSPELLCIQNATNSELVYIQNVFGNNAV